MNFGIKFENMNLAVNPGKDFFDFATAGWRKNNPIPDDYTIWSSFLVLDDITQKHIREIVEHDEGKAGLLYKIAMDVDKLNTQKTTPVKRYLDDVDNIKTKSDLLKYLGKTHAFLSAFWDENVYLDQKDSTHYLYNISQGGIGVSQDYFFDDDEKSKQVRKKYKQYIKDIMENFGVKVDAEKLYALEERMAKSFYEKEKLRDPLANYHKKSREDLKKEMSDFDWEAYFKSRGINPEYVNIAQIEPIQESIKIINDTDLDLLKIYLKFKVIGGATSFLDDKTYNIAFDFYQKEMSGQKEPKPRWKRAIGIINDSLGEMVGQLYVKKYFSENSKKRVEQLVENLKRAYEARIKDLKWMCEDTKKQAIKKLHKFNAKIGYPDKWRDYSELEIKDDSLFANMIRVSVFKDAFWLDKIGKEKDSTIWDMNAYEVNAYCDLSANEICFPAGILQPPFFDMDADDAFNYGAIGSVIGHEMTHGFDDEGRFFDVNGNMKDWWTEEDAKRFEIRTNIMKEHFNKIEVLPGVYANGEFTLGENLADYGGLTISFDAYKKFGEKSENVNGLTPEQRFFIAYATGETGNVRDEEALRRTKTNVHSLPRWRVNGILPHVEEWYNAFGISEKDGLYLSPEKRVKLW